MPFSPWLPNSVPPTVFETLRVGPIQNPAIPLLHVLYRLLVLIPQAVAWLRCYHVLQDTKGGHYTAIILPTPLTQKNEIPYIHPTLPYKKI